MDSPVGPASGGSELFGSILDSLDVALICCDREGLLLWWNVAATHFFARARGRLKVGTPLEEWMRAKAEAGYAPVRRAARGPGPALDIEEMYFSDGRRLVRQRTLLPGGQQLFSYVDVSSRLAGESETENALAAERERLSLLAEGTRDGVFERDLSTGQAWYSTHCHEMLGLSDGILCGERSRITERLHPDDEQSYIQMLSEAHSRKDRVVQTTRRLRHADGSWRWILSRSRIVYAPSGEASRMIGSWTDITADKASEEALREREQGLRDAQRLARIGSWKRMADGRRNWSDQMYALLGLPLEILPDDQAVLAMVRAEDREKANLGCRVGSELCSGVENGSAQYRLTRPDGTSLILSERTVVERSETGEITAIHGTVQDVTERVEAVEAVKESEARLSAILDTAMVGFISVDEEGRIVNFNAEARKIFGYDSAEIRGQNIDILIPPRARSEHREKMADFAGSETRQRTMSIWRTVHGLRRDGSLVPLAAGISKVRIGDKVTMTVIFRDMSDIQAAETELKQLSEERAHQLEELARRTLLLQRVMDTVTDGMAIVEDEAGAVLWNHAFTRLVAAASRPGECAMVPLKASMIELLARLGVDGETIASILRDRDRKHECVLGDARALQIQVLKSGEGSSLLWVSDISRRRGEEAERMALQERLLQSQKNDAIGAIAGTMSHDFNNLLTIILGFATLSKSQLDVVTSLPAKLPTDDPQAKRALGHMAKATSSIAKSLENIISGATRGKSIVAGLTGFAKGRPSDLAVSDLAKTMGFAGRLIGASLPTSITFRSSGFDSNLPVRHDRGRIEQVLMNLCINSAHAIGERAGAISIGMSRLRTDGGRASSIVSRLDDPDARRLLMQADPDGWSHVWCGCLPVGEFARIDVSDTGSGMNAETMRKMFEPFFTTKPQGQGTGLGLLSVSRIIEEHGGAIHVRSRHGEGTVFSIFLPVAETSDPTAEPAPPAESDAAGEPETTGTASRNRVLVVDDEEHLTELVQISLERAGYVVETFNDADAALSRFTEDPTAFSLVITDQTMPKITGIELAGRIAEMRGRMPVLLCTGYSAKAIDEKNLPVGIVGLLRKPFTPKELLAKVQSILGRDQGAA